jgi:hypothetical protein
LFWQRMKEMAQRTRELVADLPSSGSVLLENLPDFPPGGWAVSVNLAGIHTNRLAFLDTFASTMSVLQVIAQKELSRQPLSVDEITFVQGIIANPFAYAGIRDFSGWYPKLFYANVHQRLPYQNGGGPDQWDALVTDVHTDTFDLLRGDPGSVLHEGVGNVHLLMMAVDCGPGDRAVYAGPVMSHYEFELGPNTRMTDSEWKAKVSVGDLPPQPDWTRCYLVPNP